MILVRGEEYVRRDIHRAFGGGVQRGISVSATNPVILLFVGLNGARYGYNNEVSQDGRIAFVGEGRYGDMLMAGGNKALLNAAADGRTVHLFMQTGIGRVRYEGAARVLGHRAARSPDGRGVMRRTIVFELQLTNRRSPRS